MTGLAEVVICDKYHAISKTCDKTDRGDTTVMAFLSLGRPS
jgi:hypothetical protein